MKTVFSLRVLLGFSCLLGASLQAQVAVYRLSFETTGETVNYRPYQNGYYIAPIQGGTGSLVLTQITGGQRKYFSYANFGESFVALSGEKKRMVLSATAANDVSTTVFYAIGTTDKEIEVETRNANSQIKVATKLKGFAISADSEQDLPFSGAGNSVGVAGASVLTAKYDETLSRAAIRDGLSVAAELALIIDSLESTGYVDGKTTDAPVEPTPEPEPTTPPVTTPEEPVVTPPTDEETPTVVEEE